MREKMQMMTVVLAVMGLCAWGHAVAAETPSIQMQCDVVFLLDNSGSMMANDPSFRVRDVVPRFVQGLPDGSRVEIIIFGDTAEVALPLSPVGQETQKSISDAVLKITYKSAYTDIAGALERGFSDLKDNRREDAARFVVFLTDGKIDTGKPAEDKSKETWVLNYLATDMALKGVRLFCLALGEQSDFMLLQSLGLATHGGYNRIANDAQIQTAFDEIARAIATRTEAMVVGPRPEPENKTGTGSAPAVPIAKNAGTKPETPSIVSTGEGDGKMEATGKPEGGQGGPSPSGVTGGGEAPSGGTPGEQGGGAGGGSDAEKSGHPTAGPEGVTPGTVPGGESKDAGTVAPPAAPTVSWLERWGKSLLVALAFAFVALIGGAMYFLLRPVDHAEESAPKVPDEMAIEEAYLEDVHGVTGASRYQIHKRVTTIGRSPELDVCVPEDRDPDHRVSAFHATVEYRNGNFYVVDQRSTNGTYVNKADERLPTHEPRLIKSGETISMASDRFLFRLVVPAHGDVGQTMAFNRTHVAETTPYDGGASDGFGSLSDDTGTG